MLKVKTISYNWKKFASSLRLSIDTINIIEADHGKNCEMCLHKALEHWFRKDYDYKAYGNPCWRKVCISVKEAGDAALAEKISREHLLSSTYNTISSTKESGMFNDCISVIRTNVFL